MKQQTQTQHVQQKETQARPTISIAQVITTGPDTAAFTGWGPKVTAGNLLKNWN